MDQKKIGLFLRELRTEKGLTQEQLAEKINVSGRTVSRWENGNNMPDLSIIVELADFYAIDIRELLNGERKSEKMNEDLKETLEAVAEYSAAEKKKMIKESVFMLGFSAVIFVALGIMIVFKLIKEFEWFAFCCTILGLTYSVGCIIRLLQLTNIINKDSAKKTRKYAIIIVAVLLVLTVAATVFTVWFCLVG
ncbi:MAG: helix-turn-helix domain-containing protein [Clostridia bacterium]|nr:helix-turn-helix domain-containing protein [Clostridia bacterium]